MSMVRGSNISEAYKRLPISRLAAARLLIAVATDAAYRSTAATLASLSKVD